jgi:hypothetical protein
MAEKKEEAKKPTARKTAAKKPAAKKTTAKKSTTKVGGKDGVEVDKNKGVVKGTKDAIKETSTVAVEADTKANVGQSDTKEIMSQPVNVMRDNRKSSNAFIERQKAKRNKK